MRRLISAMMLAPAAGTLVPAAGASRPCRLPAVPQGFGVRLVDVPVSEADNPRALRYIIDYLPAGTVIHRRILVVNQESRHGAFHRLSRRRRDRRRALHRGRRGDQQRADQLDQRAAPDGHPPPGASAMDMITIRVPAGATRGEHYGVIWVQQTAQSRSPPASASIEVSRVGIRVYLAVGPGGAPPTSFAITSITAHRSASGQPFIVAHVDNTGGRAIDLDGTVRLAGGPGSS